VGVCRKGFFIFKGMEKGIPFSPGVELSLVNEGRASSGRRENEGWQHLFKAFQRSVGYK
jgi:hypothetical protein